MNLDHNRPDIVFEDKQNKNYLIIDIACPSDRRLDIKQQEKVNKYLDVAVEIKELRKINSVKVVLVLNGVLGSVADANLQIRGGGGGYPPKFFSALRASFWSKNKEGQAPPGPSPGSAAGVIPSFNVVSRYFNVSPNLVAAPTV